jgi:hypothetical protein
MRFHDVPSFQHDFSYRIHIFLSLIYSVIIGIYEVAGSCIFSFGIVTMLIPEKSKERGWIPGTAKKF